LHLLFLVSDSITQDSHFSTKLDLKMNAVMDALNSIVISEEIMTFFCALAVYYILHQARKPKSDRNRKNVKYSFDSDACKVEAELDTSSDSAGPDKMSRSQIDKSLHAAFEAEDYWQVLNCLRTLKRLRQCPPMHLSQIIKAMQCCNKSAYAIGAEVKDYLKVNPEKRNMQHVNDIIEPLARGLDDRVGCQLVDYIVQMLPSLNLQKDARTYEILLTMHAARQNPTRFQETATEMRENKVAFTPCARAAVLTIALQLSNADATLKAFAALKPSWDVRSTWAVSPFAVQRHKTMVLTQVVKLTCDNGKLGQLLPMLDDMKLSQESLDVVRDGCEHLSEMEIVSALKLIPVNNEGSVNRMLLQCLDARSTPLAKIARKKVQLEVCSDASTSEGARSDSESGDEEFVMRAAPGLAPPPGF
jgi:hypothetical protein